jgi:hypothetical protein
MPSPQVKLTLDYNRRELIREYFGVGRDGRNFRFSALNSAGELVASAVPEHLWREPNTGYYMLRPTFAHPQHWEDPAKTLSQGLADFNSHLPGLLEVGDTAGAQRILLQMGGYASVIPSLAVLGWTAALRDALSQAIIIETDPFEVNEGFAFTFQPYGTARNRVSDYIAVYFGGSYCLVVDTGGNMKFYYGVDDDGSGSPAYRLLERYHYAEAAAGHRTAVQVAVIPFGPRFLSIVISSHPMTTGSLASVAGGAEFSGHFLVDLAKHKIDAPSIPTTGQYQKTASSPLYVGIRREGLYAYDFSIHRVRYLESCTFTLMPEPMTTVRPNSTPTIAPYGYAYDLLGGGGYANLTGFVVNSDLAAWDPLTDTDPTPKFTMAPEQSGLYSPELWQYDLSIDGETAVAEFTEYDASAEWQRLRFHLSAGNEPTRFEAKLRRDDFDRLYKKGGPVRLDVVYPGSVEPYTAASYVPVFDGYLMNRQPTVSGRIVTDECEGLDMWHRLDSTPLDMETLPEELNVGPLLKRLIKRAGFEDSQITVDAVLDSLPQGKSEEPGQVKSYAPDTTVGTAVRDVIKRHAFAGRDLIRVRWEPSWSGTEWVASWNVTLAPTYDPAVPPSIRFYAASLMPAAADTARWLAGDFRIKSDLEFTIGLPEFNWLRCSSTTSVKQDAGGLLSDIEPHYKTLTDPTDWRYEGRARVLSLSPPEVTAQTQNELDRFARSFYQFHHSGTVVLACEAEYQPGLIKADMFVEVRGVNPSGDPVSFGAFRIENADCEIRRDAYRHEWAGNYTLVYVGETADPDFPMFSTFLPVND